MSDKIGNYFSTNSNMHNMNPISKVLCTIIFILMALLSFNIEVSMVLMLLIMIMIMNTNIPLSVYYYIIKKFRYFLIIIFFLFSLLTLSLLGGLTTLINITLIILELSILTMTTPPTEIVFGLEKILKPLNKINIKSNQLALKISMALRFIPTLLDESDKILKAQASRGIDYQLSLKNKIKAYKNMIKPAIHQTKEKQKELKKSMELRLFSIDKERTNYRINKWTFFDTYMLILHILILIIIIIRGVI